MELSLMLSPAPPAHFTVKVDGILVVATTALSGTVAGSATLSVRLGLLGIANASADFRVLVDNVEAEVTP